MGSRIPPGDRFRDRARECMEAGDRAADPGRRVALLELAQRWLMLAGHIDGVEPERQLRGDALLDYAPDHRVEKP